MRLNKQDEILRLRCKLNKQRETKLNGFESGILSELKLSVHVTMVTTTCLVMDALPLQTASNYPHDEAYFCAMFSGELTLNNNNETHLIRVPVPSPWSNIE